jgi:hypothetical protein
LVGTSDPESHRNRHPIDGSCNLAKALQALKIFCIVYKRNPISIYNGSLPPHPTRTKNVRGKGLARLGNARILPVTNRTLGACSDFMLEASPELSGKAIAAATDASLPWWARRKKDEAAGKISSTAKREGKDNPASPRLLQNSGPERRAQVRRLLKVYSRSPRKDCIATRS